MSEPIPKPRIPHKPERPLPIKGSDGPSHRPLAAGQGIQRMPSECPGSRPPNGQYRSRAAAARLGAMTPQPGWNPGRAAGNTVIVIVTLVGLLCVLPVVVFCLLPGLFGAIFNP